MALLNIVPPPNFSHVLASSVGGAPGNPVVIAALPVAQRRAGVFAVEGVCAVTVTGAGTPLGVTAEIVSTLVGEVGPAVNFYGGSTTVQVSWTDNANPGVGNTVQYFLKMIPLSGSNSIAIAANAGALIVREL